MPERESKRGKAKGVHRQVVVIRTSKAAKRALDLRIAGHTYQQIADLMKMSKSTVSGYVTRELGHLRSEVTEASKDLMALEIARIDVLTKELWPHAMEELRKAKITAANRAERDWKKRARAAEKKGELFNEELITEFPLPVLAVVDRLIKLSEHRAKLLGLNAPIKTQDMTWASLVSDMEEFGDIIEHEGPVH